MTVYSEEVLEGYTGKKVLFALLFVLWVLGRLLQAIILLSCIVIDTCFVLWSFSRLYNLFFVIVIDTCEEKLALWHVVKYGLIEWLFIDCFCLIIWHSTGSLTWTSLWVFLNDLDCVFHLPQLVPLILFKSTFFTEHF